MNKIIFIFLCLISTQLKSQVVRCGYDFMKEKHIKQYPEIKHLIREQEKKIKQNKKNTNNIIYNIPVVVHVLYNNNNQNISDTQILSQIDILNEDFRRTNEDTINTPYDFLQYASDCKINFCLARRDPNNNTTNGITRTYTNETSFNITDKKIYYDSLGGKDAWNSKKYLNIWVANIDNLAGFSTFPGYPFEEEDGVVINYSYFGNTGTASFPFNKGRTTTHEVGHWLNLIHIWGDMNCGDDFVYDTPTQENPNFGCPSHPKISCNNNGDMFQNYMDYSNDGCMNIFTDGQKQRMRATLDTIRTELISCNNGCIEPLEDAGVISILNISENQQICSQEISPIIEIKNFSSEELLCLDIEYLIDGFSYYYFWEGQINSLQSETIQLPIISNLNNGLHNITIFSTNPNNSVDQNTNNDSLSINFNIFAGETSTININTDNYGDEVSWRIVDQNDSIWYSGANLPDNALVNYAICLPTGVCYDFIIEDSYNDGICCQFGNGYIEINNNTYNGDYNNQLIVENFNCLLSNTELLQNTNIKVFPNPSKGKINILTETLSEKIRYNIIDIYGNFIYKGEINKKRTEINLQVKNGVYMISFFVNKKIITKKIIINK